MELPSLLNVVGVVVGRGAEFGTGVSAEGGRKGQIRGCRLCIWDSAHGGSGGIVSVVTIVRGSGDWEILHGQGAALG